MEFLEKVDLIILDGFFQKIADWVNDRWGKSCFWLAGLCEWVVVLIVTGGGLALYKEGTIGFWGGCVVFGLACYFLYLVRQNQKKDEWWTQFEGRRVANPERRFSPCGLMRLATLFINVQLSFPLLASLVLEQTPGRELIRFVLLAVVMVYALVWFCSSYFTACTPKPRSPLKVGNKLAVSPAPSR